MPSFVYVMPSRAVMPSLFLSGSVAVTVVTAVVFSGTENALPVLKAGPSLTSVTRTMRARSCCPRLLAARTMTIYSLSPAALVFGEGL